MKKLLSFCLVPILLFIFCMPAFAVENDDTYIIMYTKQSYKYTLYEDLFSDHREFLNPENYGIKGISDISVIAAYRDDNPQYEPPYYVLAIRLSDKSLAEASFYAAEILMKGISNRAFAADKNGLDEFLDNYLPEGSIPEAHFALYTHGDIMCNNQVDAASARAVLRISVGLDKKENYPYLLGDMNGDGILTASDARTILRISAGLG